MCTMQTCINFLINISFVYYNNAIQKSRFGYAVVVLVKPVQKAPIYGIALLVKFTFIAVQKFCVLIRLDLVCVW